MMNPFKKYNLLLGSLSLVALSAAGAIYWWTGWDNSQVPTLQLPERKVSQVVVPKAEKRADEPVVPAEQPTQNSPALGAPAKSGFLAKIMSRLNPGETAYKSVVAKPKEVLDPSPFTFAVIGDADAANEQGYEKNFPAVLSAVKDLSPELTFFSGDMLKIDPTNPIQSRTMLGNYKNLLDSQLTKYSLVFGDGDLLGGKPTAEMWQEIFFGTKANPSAEPKLFHSFDFHNVHFVMLSSNYPANGALDDGQLKWLEKDLAGTKQLHKVVFSHYSPENFSLGKEAGCQDLSCDPAKKAALVSVLEKYGVELVISGHRGAFDHQVKGKIDYVLSGSVGKENDYEGIAAGDIFTLVEVDGQKMHLKAIEKGGKVIREIAITE